MRIRITIGDSDPHSTARVVNRLLAILNLLAGAFLGLALVGVSALFISDMGAGLLHLRPQQQITALIMVLVLAVCTLQIAAGILMLLRAPGARELALLSSALFVWYLPVGTLLCFATWWFLLFSESGRTYYGKAARTKFQGTLLPV